ncbi:GNAT family N-acetyltransferase [Chryseobacterium sp. DT-3]|uniref:GNAT family N-acetyltransferase n=1 Tax=Chryseobacterium sp. DT-3 TaxID=3396164 RepID=UPI003F192CDE
MCPPNFSSFPVLETDRLILRRLSLGDAEEIYQLRSDVDVAILTGRTPCANIDEAIAYINKIDSMINKNECIFWAVSKRENPDLIGVACLWNFDIKKGTVEIGYELLEKFQGKGIMGEVIVRILQYAFDVMGAETIIAFPSGENPSSVRLLQKLGFELAPGHFKNTHINVPNILTYILPVQNRS